MALVPGDSVENPFSVQIDREFIGGGAAIDRHHVDETIHRHGQMAEEQAAESSFSLSWLKLV